MIRMKKFYYNVTTLICVFIKGLRFSGVNETEYRVYLLGNPVSLHYPVVALILEMHINN